MKRVLVVSVNWLGDSILLTPAFKALKKARPSCYVAVMAHQRVREVFSDNPYIDEVIVFDEKSSHRTLKSKLRFIKELKAKKFDTVFLVHRSFTRAFICLLAGIRKRIGYARFKSVFVVNERVSMPPKDIHRQDYYLWLFERAGISVAERNPKFFIPPAIEETSKSLLGGVKDLSCLIGMNVTANWRLKRWPKDFFSLLADRITQELGCCVVLIGASQDSGLVDEVARNMKSEAINLCGKTSLKELGAIIKKCSVFISNDSGPAHLAASLGVATLVLFGPTSAAITSPRGNAVMIVQKDTGCKIPCYRLDCADNICMKNISVEEVFQETKKIIAR